MASLSTVDSRSFLVPLAMFAAGLVLAVSIGCKPGGPAKTAGPNPSETAADSATDTPEPAAKPSEPKPTTGRQVLERMVAAYRKATSYADQATVHMQAEAEGRKVQDMTAKFSLALVRPNKVRVEAYDGQLVCDGKRLFAAVTDLPGQVLLTDAPPRLTLRSVYRDWRLTKALTEGFAGGMPQVILMLADDPLDALLHGADEPMLSEASQIGDHNCYRVKINRDLVGTTTFWIDQETFLLRRVVLPTDEWRRALSQEQPVDSLSMIADFTGAEFNAPPGPATFEYEVPKDAKAVAYLLPPHMGQLLNRKTPPFEFRGLDGKPVTPDTLAGKVAVLEFWSYGYDCKQSLQDLEQVYQRYKNNPRVAFYAVCLDPPELKDSEVARAIEDLKVHVPVVRGSEQVVAPLLNLPPPPVTFIINDKGIVQHCEAGYVPEFARSLSQRIDKVLAGEDVSQDAQRQYQEQVDFIKEFAKSADQPDKLPDSGKAVQDVPLPQAKIAPRTEPARLKLAPLWTCTEVRSPGNILLLPAEAGTTNQAPRLLVVENYKSLAEVGLDGKVLARHDLKLAPEEFIGCLRAAAGADGRRYVATFLWTQQRCHVLDDKWNTVADYPQDALQNPHSGITDVQLGDLDGSGQLKLFVSYAGVVGVQCATLDGKRLWSNRSIVNVSSLAVGGLAWDKRRELLCANAGAMILLLDAQGKRGADLHVDDSLRRIVAAQLRGSGEPMWCGTTAGGKFRDEVVGFSLQGRVLWTYNKLPEGVPPPIEPIIAGRVTREDPGQWLLPGPDGSIHILSVEGKLVDKFNYGAALQGLATVDIDGRPALVVATAKGLEAWRVQ